MRKKYTVEEIRGIMAAENLTMTQMAKRLKMKLARLSHWLSGRTKPTDKLETLEEALAAIPKLPNLDYAWMAGFVEADGCISVMKSGGRNSERSPMTRFGMALLVNQKDPRPIHMFVKAFGGRVRTTTKKHKSGPKRYFVWALRANQAYAALTHLLPYLKVKREQALVAMSLQESVNTWRGGFGRYAVRPEHVIEERRLLYFQCKHLNSQAYIEELNAASGEFGGPLTETIPSQAAEGKDPAEGVTASSLSPNNNANQERPTNVIDFGIKGQTERAG